MRISYASNAGALWAKFRGHLRIQGRGISSCLSQLKRGLFAYQLLHINSGLLWVLYIGMKKDVYIRKETYMLKRPIFPSALAYQLGFVVGTVYGMKTDVYI